MRLLYSAFLALGLCAASSVSALANDSTAAPAENRSGGPAANVDASAESTNAIEAEYQKLLSDDDAAEAEVDKMIQDNEKFQQQGAGISPGELSRRIRDRLAPVGKAYEDFLKRHPDHVKARVAYGSFLGDLNDEEGERKQLEMVLGVVTNDPAVYNNLANIYGHHGPVKKAFEFYEKALSLNPKEPVYYQNFATTVFLFRVDAREYYGITEQEVFDKAMNLYSNALYFDPTNFSLASDVAQTYYGIKPPRTEEALKAWTNALALAHDDLEREGVYIHFARLKLHSGRFDEARAHLNDVTNAYYAKLKERLTKNIEEFEPEFRRTNHAATQISSPREGSKVETPPGGK